MASPIIKIKRSSVQGKKPAVADLPLGELALNTYDGRLYVSKSTDSGVTTSIVNVSGIEVQDEGISVGYANTINFVGSGVSVSSFTDGIGVVNIDSSGGGETYWSSTSSGIHTLSNVGIGTTNPTSALTVKGDAYVTGIVTAKRFETDWPGPLDYNFVAGYQAGELADTFCEYNVLIGYQAGYDLASSDDNVAIGRQSLYGGSSNNTSNGNIALGYRSLYAITTGDYNISLGYSAGQGLTSGSNNIILGYFAAGVGALSGSNNIALGNQSAYFLSTGLENVFIGALSGYNITTGDYNVCIGFESGYNLDSNQTGNTLIGYESGFSSNLGDYNVAVGYQAGYSQESDYSVFMGYQSGYNSGSSYASVALGFRAGYDLEGNYNVAIGPDTMYAHNGSGEYNVAVGFQALYQDGTSSSYNIAIGYQALYGELTTTGDYNIGVGYQAGDEITTGNGNLLLGNQAGDSITTGSDNVVLVGGSSNTIDVTSGTSNTQLVIGSGSTAWITGDSSYNVTIPGNLTASNISIAGTLTYDDVTNIDSVGLITARSGIVVSSGGINAVGVITASGGFNLGISSAGTSITSGPVTTLNFIGAGNTFAVNGTTVDISIAGGGGGASVSISTTPPVSPNEGDLWYSSELGRTFIYYVDVDSSQWVDAAPFNIPEPTATPGKSSATFTATEGQTSFTVSYTVGYIDVFMNGVRLNSAEFVENGGTSVVLQEPASAGDVIDVVEYRMGIGDTGATGAAGPLSGVTSITNDATYYPLIVTGTGTVDPYVSIASSYFNFNPASGTLVVNQMSVVGVSTARDFNSSSDANLKKNIQVIQDPIDKIQKITGVSFDWKEVEQSSIGVIAQDVEKVLPELVSDFDGKKTVNYNGLIGVLIEAVKNQQEQINTLRKEIDKLTK